MTTVDFAKNLADDAPPPALPAEYVAQVEQLVDVLLDGKAKPRMYQGQQSVDPYQSSVFDGGDFQFGFGPTTQYSIDYYALRERSEQLLIDNPYALGVMSRIVTAFVNTGVHPEIQPKEQILGLDQGALEGFTMMGEQRFDVWSESPEMCDHAGMHTFTELQQLIELEAMVGGDVLVVLRANRKYRTYSIQLIKAGAVQSPTGTKYANKMNGRKVHDGVEVDRNGNEVAYWYNTEEYQSARVNAIDRTSGFRRAWLVRVSRARLNRYRGIPLLANVLQLLADVNRLRASALRQAYVASLLSVFIQKTAPGMPSLSALGAGINRRADGSTLSDERDYDRPEPQLIQPTEGMILTRLAEGETPVAFNSAQATNTNLATFIEIMLEAVSLAWNVPVDTLRMKYDKSFSASTSANMDLQHGAAEFWERRGNECYSHVLRLWLLREIVDGRIDEPRVIDLLGDAMYRTEFKAYFSFRWYGSVKPSPKLTEQVQAYSDAVDRGWVTNAEVARTVFGNKFTSVVAKLTAEDALLQARPNYVVDQSGTPSTTNGRRPAPDDAADDDAGGSSPDDSD